MELLRTIVETQRSTFEIDHKTPLFFIGSCFSDNIGQTMKNAKFDVLCNPFGVQYNPASIANNLTKALNGEMIKDEELAFHSSKWHSYLLHGSFSNKSKEQLLEKGNTQYITVQEKLKRASVNIITFGTAWIYELKNSNQVVSNCHKIPASQFQRRRLSVDEIKLQWKKVLKTIIEINPDARFIFTVSPVRHLKDGAHENQLSKSTLLLAIEGLINEFGEEKCQYFPAYEIINDELRDYRFYSEDMTHISSLGVRVIFEKFKATYFTPQTMNALNEITKIMKAKEHRIDHVDLPALKEFANSMLRKINRIETDHNYINFQLEKKYFNNLLKM